MIAGKDSPCFKLVKRRALFYHHFVGLAPMKMTKRKTGPVHKSRQSPSFVDILLIQLQQNEDATIKNNR